MNFSKEEAKQYLENIDRVRTLTRERGEGRISPEDFEKIYKKAIQNYKEIIENDNIT